MKHSEMVQASQRLQEAGEPHLVTGPPGGGKTAGLVQACGTLKRRVIIMHPVISEEVDYRGLPGFVKHEKTGELRAVFLPFGALRELCETTTPTTCIIDDVGQARLSVQAALMQLVHLREVDGTRISDSVTFALATNRREDRAAVQGFVSALMDRMTCVLELEFDADELARYLLTKGYPTILSAFVRFRPGSIKFDSKDDFVKNSTPRSIEGLGRLLNLGLGSIEMVSGAVGKAFASEFLAYRKVENKLPKIAEILAKPEKAPVPEEKDVLYALTAALAGAITSKNLTPACVYLDRLPPEFAVFVMKDVAQKLTDIVKEPAFLKWARANGKLLGV